MEHQDRSDPTRVGKWMLIGFLAVVAAFFWAEHRAHLLGALPYLLLLSCPLVHLVHHGHGSHGYDHENHKQPGGREPDRTRRREGGKS